MRSFQIIFYLIILKSFLSDTELASSNSMVSEAILKICGNSWKNFEVYLIKSMKLEGTLSFNDLVQDVALKLSKHNAIHIESVENIFDLETRRRGFTIIFIDELESFYIFLHKVSPETFKFKGFYLIVSMKSSIDIGKMFDAMWKLMIFNVDVLIYDWSLESINLTTFLPFSDGTCNNLKPVKINEFNISTMRWKNSDFFPKKFKNLQQCSIRVGTYESAPGLIIRNVKNKTEIYGFEGDMFNVIAARLNFTMNITAVTYGGGSVDKNGTATGLVEKIMLNEFDLIMSLFSVNYYRNIFLTPTKPYYVDKMIVIIPADRLLDSFLKIFFVFNYKLWLTLFVVFGLASFVIKLLQSKVSALDEIRAPVMSLFVAIIGGSERNLPRKDFPRILVATFLLFCMVVRTVYQGGLFNMLKQDIRINEIKTLQDINKHHYTFFIIESIDVKVKDLQIFQR